MNAIVTKCQKLETAQLIEVAQKAAARMDEDGDIVLDAALTVLELRMSTAAFIALCDDIA
jgi:hypothetical protein